MSQFIIRVYATSDAPWPVQLSADSACEMDGGPWGHTRKSEKDRECMREDKGWAGKEREREGFQIQNSLVNRGFQTGFPKGPQGSSVSNAKKEKKELNFKNFHTHQI